MQPITEVVLPTRLPRRQSPTDKITVGIIDDHPIFRSGVRETLSAEPDIAVVGEGCSAADALRLAQDERPDVIMLDMSMPGGGLSALQQMTARYPDVKPLVLGGSVDTEQIRSALQNGAWGSLMRGVSGTELIRAVHAVHGGEKYVTSALAAMLFRAVPVTPAKVVPDVFATLTVREEQVLALIADGLSNKEIGRRLELREKTFKHYLTIVMDKLGVRTRVQAALLAHARLAG
jgi:two-component system nitrate/nitrite response regulator NarL